MDNASRSHYLLGDLLTLICALVILLAFLFVPWFELADGTSVSGYRIAADTGGDLDLATRTSHMFLSVLPVAAIAAGMAALTGLLSERYNPRLPGLTLLIGLMAVGYYYGAFFFENRQSNVDAFGYVGPGFYLALLAALGLIVQYALPRPGVSTAIRLPSLTPPELGEVPVWWRWPFVVLGWAWQWVRVLFGWLFGPIGRLMSGTSTLAYLFGMVAAVKLEERAAEPLAELLGFRRGRAPGLFGATKLLEPFSDLDFSGILAPFFPAPTDPTDEPLRRSWDALSKLLGDFADALFTQDPRSPGFFDALLDVIVYDLLIYIIPVLIVALLLRSLSNRVLLWLPFWGGITLQLLVLYLAVETWGALSDYRELVLIFMGVNIMLSVSLNLVNGYMGEFSVGHGGFMAVGAYVSSILTMWLFVDESVFGDAVLTTTGLALPIGFLIALIAGGVAAALAGLLVAFPSFRTRGDYLAIVTLAVNYIVVGVLNTQEWIGGPRGLKGAPLWTTLPWIFVMTVLSVIAIYNLVSSTFGKGIAAIREDEIAAELMGVNTKRVKLVAFLVSSFIAGAAGGLFAHELGYINPTTFDIRKSTEVLVMVYLGGMGSITGSIVAAVIFTILIEAFRPLAVLKWVVVPLILILLMLYRPQGLFGFREINLNLGGIKDDDLDDAEQEAADAAAGD